MDPLDDRELDALRQVMIAMSPGLQADVQAMTNIMREMVDIERKKMGLDRVDGKLFLKPYEKKDRDDPDFTGSGTIAGRSYRAAAWISKNGTLQIGIVPQRPKK